MGVVGGEREISQAFSILFVDLQRDCDLVHEDELRGIASVACGSLALILLALGWRRVVKLAARSLTRATLGADDPRSKPKGQHMDNDDIAARFRAACLIPDNGAQTLRGVGAELLEGYENMRAHAHQLHRIAARAGSRPSVRDAYAMDVARTFLAHPNYEGMTDARLITEAAVFADKMLAYLKANPPAA